MNLRLLLIMMTGPILAGLPSACASSGDAVGDRPAVGQFIFVPPVEIYETADCISLENIRSMQIIDRTAIAYEMPDRKIWINRPRWGATTLNNDLVMIAGGDSHELCDGDVVHFIENSPRGGRSTIALGQFVSHVPAEQGNAPRLSALSIR